MIYLKLAWRNIWRNRRRTLITLTSIIFAMVLALAMRSSQLGSYRHTINSAVSTYTGHGQIQARGYWENRSINKSLTYDTRLKNIIQNQAGINSFAPRLESFVLIAHDTSTRSGRLIGIDPGRETDLTSLRKRLVEGNYPQAAENKLLLTTGLARSLGVQVGDTVILLGQGYHGRSAAGKYPVGGLVEYSVPQLNNQLIYLPLKEASWFFSTPGRITSLAFLLRGDADLSTVLAGLKNKLGSKYVVRSWRELMPELVQAIMLDNVSGLITLAILYLVIGFGILGTILMMIQERRHEFGVLVSNGMQRWQLALMVCLESLFLAGIGVFIGVVVASPILLYLNANPIPFTGTAGEAMLAFGFEPLIVFSVAPGMFLSQAVVVLFISAIASLAPLWTIFRFKIVEALEFFA